MATSMAVLAAAGEVNSAKRALNTTQLEVGAQVLQTVRDHSTSPATAQGSAVKSSTPPYVGNQVDITA